MNTSNEIQALGGSFTFPGTSMTVHRMGYGAMQLTGPGVFGPPRDPDAAVAVLREAVAAGVNHIDTSDFYGPHLTNQIIRRALHPYPKELVIVTKVGFRRLADKDEWGSGFVPVTGSEGLPPGATSPSFTLKSQRGYTSTDSRQDMLHNSHFVDAKVEISAKYGSQQWTRVAEYPIARVLLTK